MGTLQFTEEVLTTYKMRIAVIVALFACVAYASACAACGGGGGGHSHSYGSSCGHSHSSHSHSSHSSSSSCGGSGEYRPPKCRKLHFADLPNGGVLNYQKIKHNDVDANSNVRPHIPFLPQNCVTTRTSVPSQSPTLVFQLPTLASSNHPNHPAATPATLATQATPAQAQADIHASQDAHQSANWRKRRPNLRAKSLHSNAH